MEVGKELLDRALDKCKSPYQLSKLVGVSQGNLSEMIHGTRGIPPTLVGELAAFLGEDPRTAALAAMIDKEKKPERRAMLARLFGLHSTGGEGGIRTLGTGLPYA